MADKAKGGLRWFKVKVTETYEKTLCVRARDGREARKVAYDAIDRGDVKIAEYPSWDGFERRAVETETARPGKGEKTYSAESR